MEGLGLVALLILVFILGGLCGVLVTSCVVVSKENDEEDYDGGE